MSLQITIAGDVADFDDVAQDVFKDRLVASFSGVEKNNIRLSIVAASVSVTVRVIMPSILKAETLAMDLSSTPTSNLMTLLGVTVEAVNEPSTQACSNSTVLRQAKPSSKSNPLLCTTSQFISSMI